MRVTLRSLRKRGAQICRRVAWVDRDLRFSSVEGLVEYDFVLPAERSAPGVSAMLRVRNEESKITLCLRSILPLFDEIVVVDNGSTDRTRELVETFRQAHDSRRVIRVLDYPHEIARRGPEHRATPAASVHSQVYFNNWCRSQCRHSWLFRWDGDMVVAHGQSEPLRSLFQEVQRSAPAIWHVPAQTLYRALDGAWYRAPGEVYAERRLAPNRSAVRYYKGRNTSNLRSSVRLPARTFAPVCIYELKDTREREFSGWSTTEIPNLRHQREWRNLALLRDGQVPPDVFERMSGPIFAEASERLPC